MRRWLVISSLIIVSLLAVFTFIINPNILNGPSPSPPTSKVPTSSNSSTKSPTNASSNQNTSNPPPNNSSTTHPTPTPTPHPTQNIPPIKYSIGISNYQKDRGGSWYSINIAKMQNTSLTPGAYFEIQNTSIKNRENGQISPILESSYIFANLPMQISNFIKYDNTTNALFIRTTSSLVDYLNQTSILNWSNKSAKMPINLRDIIRECNNKGIPVFLELNYSNYIPGPVDSDINSLIKTDNIANTINFLKFLKSEGLSVTGVTFGDEIDDTSVYPGIVPNMHSSDIANIYISYATTLKNEFPDLKIYAFNSYISATRGQMSTFWPLLIKIRDAEIKEKKPLIDGFCFRESYVYMSKNGTLLDSQKILDDTESLYRNTTMYRFDVDGTRHSSQNLAYLPTIINYTNHLFGRQLDIGITEYLPAGPIGISESNTTRYSDMDFIIHYCDTVGIYSQLGLDTVSTWMFAGSNQQTKSYIDKNGNEGPNFPVHEQIAQYYKGTMLNITRSNNYNDYKVKVYAARNSQGYFIMILNKDVKQERTIRLTLPGQLGLALNLPPRSYTSLIVNGKDIKVSGIGN